MPSTTTANSKSTVVTAGRYTKKTLAQLIEINHRYVMVVKDEAGFEQLKDDWSDLLAESDNNRVCMSWEWMRQWWEVFKDDPKIARQLNIICIYDQFHVLLAIAPFQIVQKRPESIVMGRMLAFLGDLETRQEQVLTENLDLVCRRQHAAEVCQTLSNYFQKNHTSWDTINLRYVMSNANISNLLESNDLKQHQEVMGNNFYVDGRMSFDQYIGSLRHRWRKDYQKKMRLLHRDGEVKIVDTAINAKNLDANLALLAQMNRERWSKKGEKEFVFDDLKFHRFHSNILKTLAPKKQANIRVLYLNNEPLAAMYCFEDESSIYFYQCGFFSQHANRYSPLFLLVCSQIEHALQRGKHFDFMFSSAGESYKATQYAALKRPVLQYLYATHRHRILAYRTYKLSKDVAQIGLGYLKRKWLQIQRQYFSY